jgi:hypothetical protein
MSRKKMVIHWKRDKKDRKTRLEIKKVVAVFLKV